MNDETLTSRLWWAFKDFVFCVSFGATILGLAYLVSLHHRYY